jgi:hypothetical protein
MAALVLDSPGDENLLHGFTVVGIDPAEASLDVGRAKGGGSSIAWLHSDETALPPLNADLPRK